MRSILKVSDVYKVHYIQILELVLAFKLILKIYLFVYFRLKIEMHFNWGNY